MKRLIPAAILFVTVITSYFGSLKYINDVCDAAKKQVAACETEYRNGGNAEEKVAELKKLWDEKEGALSFFVNHGEIDEVELELLEGDVSTLLALKERIAAQVTLRAEARSKFARGLALMELA